VSIFSKKNRQYTAETYNIFLSPTLPQNDQDPRHRDFSRQYRMLGSTMNFLASHKFDFNTCFTNGVQYLTRQEEAKMMVKQEQIKARLAKRIEEAKGRTSMSKGDARKKLGEVRDAAVKQYLDMYMALIDEMLADPTKDHTWLPRCNYMVTQAVYEYLVPLYAGRCVMRKELKEKEMLFKVIESTLSKDEFELAQLDKDEQKIIDKRGFVNILNQITESKTPVVFHAGWLDLILTMRQFYLSEMPPTLTEFKAATMEVFPNVFDTLLMVRNDPLKSLFLGGNRLQDIYDRTHTDPFTLREVKVSIPGQYRDYRSFGGQCHEAGYDAFMTGIAFIRMFNHLNNITKTKDIFCIDLPIAKPFLNKIAANGFYDIHHLALDKSQKVPKRDHCFHVKMPEHWRIGDVQGAFTDCGPIKVLRESDSAAFVTIEDKRQMYIDQVQYVQRQVKETHDVDLIVKSYTEWRQEQSKESTRSPKRRKVEKAATSPVRKATATSPNAQRRLHTATTTSAAANDNFIPDYKKTVKETRKLQVFEHTDMWE